MRTAARIAIVAAIIGAAPAPLGEFTGPALVEEHASTTVVFPGDQLKVTAYGDLVITIARS